MKAAERCKVHFQGDKCRKALNHHSSLILNPDPVHTGAFAAWTGETWGNKKVVARSWKPMLKMPRAFKRYLRNICSKDFNVNLLPQAQRKSATQLLAYSVKFLRRQA